MTKQERDALRKLPERAEEAKRSGDGLSLLAALTAYIVYLPRLLDEVERLELESDARRVTMNTHAAEQRRAMDDSARLRALLREVEWACSSECSYEPLRGYCPICHQPDTLGHATGCRLAAEITRPSRG